MSKWTIYHNPKCSKSRQTLDLLEKNNISPIIVEYLKIPLNKIQIMNLLNELNLEPSSLVRTKDPLYKELNFEISTAESVASHLAKYPNLMERPVVSRKGKAIIGRPPENIETLLD